MTTAPASVTETRLRRWTSESGVSRGTSTSLRRSLSVTSAARSTSERLVPPAMAATVPIEHGTDDHAVGPLRARRRQRAAVLVGKARHRVPVAAGGRTQGIQGVDAALGLQQPHAVARGHEPHRHPVPGQHLEQAHAVRGTRGARERNHHGMARHRPRRLGVGERTGCLGAEGGTGRFGGPVRPCGPALLRRTRAGPCRLHRTIRSISAKANTVTLMTPFMVKNAASSRERSPGRTNWCS